MTLPAYFGLVFLILPPSGLLSDSFSSTNPMYPQLLSVVLVLQFEGV